MISGIALLVWIFTQEGILAIMLSILADFFASIPTIVKAYKYPHTEVAWPWLTPSIGVFITFLTMKEFTFTNSAFISYVFFVNIFIYLLVRFPKARFTV